MKPRQLKCFLNWTKLRLKIMKKKLLELKNVKNMTKRKILDTRELDKRRYKVVKILANPPQKPEENRYEYSKMNTDM